MVSAAAERALENMGGWLVVSSVGGGGRGGGGVNWGSVRPACFIYWNRPKLR